MPSRVDLWPGSVTIALVTKKLIREREELIERIRHELQALVRETGWTQRRVEEANGFTQGYLSQVLKGHITLTVRHLWGILMAIGIEPEDFFNRVYRRDSAKELRERMDRYEAIFERLESQGVLKTPRSDAE